MSGAHGSGAHSGGEHGDGHGEHGGGHGSGHGEHGGGKKRRWVPWAIGGALGALAFDVWGPDNFSILPAEDETPPAAVAPPAPVPATPEGGEDGFTIVETIFDEGDIAEGLDTLSELPWEVCPPGYDLGETMDRTIQERGGDRTLDLGERVVLYCADGP